MTNDVYWLCGTRFCCAVTEICMRVLVAVLASWAGFTRKPVTSQTGQPQLVSGCRAYLVCCTREIESCATCSTSHTNGVLTYAEKQKILMKPRHSRWTLWYQLSPSRKHYFAALPFFSYVWACCYCLLYQANLNFLWTNPPKQFLTGAEFCYPGQPVCLLFAQAALLWLPVFAQLNDNGFVLLLITWGIFQLLSLFT